VSSLVNTRGFPLMFDQHANLPHSKLVCHQSHALFQFGLNFRPFVINHTEDDGSTNIAVVHNHMLSQYALLLCADAGDSALRIQVTAVGFEPDPNAAKSFKSMAHQKIFAFGVNRRAPVIPAQPGMAYLDAVVGPRNRQVASAADSLVGRFINNDKG